MMSEKALGIYFWGAYIWFVIGFVLIAFPAIYEVYKLLFVKKIDMDEFRE